MSNVDKHEYLHISDIRIRVYLSVGRGEDCAGHKKSRDDEGVHLDVD